MGKPGGFFKKLKAKQKKKATKQRRGTKGASKEERRLKYNDRVAFYSAKRQAEELAAVSSSSDDEPSTDSEAEERREEKKLRKLRRMLGVEDGNHNSRKRRKHDPHDASTDDHTGTVEGEDAIEDDASSATASEGASEKDWQYYLQEDGSEGEEEEEEDADGLMMDLGSDDDNDEEDEEVDNPLFELDSNDSLADANVPFEEDEEYDEAEEEEEDEDEEENREDDFIDEEDDEELPEHIPLKTGQPAKKQTTEETRTFLPQFKLGSSSLATVRNSTSLAEDDPWLLKYHLDTKDEVDKTGLEPVALSNEARTALEHTNDQMKQRAAEEEQHTTRKERGVFFVSPDAYDRLHPENMTVALSAHAKKDLLHPPFDFSENKKRTRATVPAAVESPPTFVHPALWEKWLNFRQKYKKPVFTAEERGLLDLLQGYPDIMDCMRCWQNSESRREIFVLHLLNHWFKARSVVLAHDKIIEMFREQKKKKKSSRPGRGAKNKKKGETEEENCESLLAEEDDIFESDNYQLRDRGFSKTRLFVMLPMRNIALQYVKTIVEVLGADPLKCSKMEMFVSDFTEVEELADPTFKRRPLDYRRQFDGNIDDSFCVGLHLQPDKVSLYAHPLNSDIIICSPLGLRKRMERSGDIAVSLSSVEVCLVDEAHVLLLQNWDHPAAVMEMLNKRPTETTHGLSDLRRVYSWALEGKSGRHRQTIISSNVSHATLLGAFRGSVNSSGKVLLQPVQSEGAVTRVVGGIRQHFMRFDATALDKVDDERFNFFTESIFPTKINTLAERDVRIIIFVPSYFDFVRLRNYLYKEYRDTFAALSEYSSLAQQRQALGQFSDLERPVLLVTERFYFFKRYFVKLAEVMVFYSPPVMSEYYSDLINKLVLTSPNALSLTVYCRYDTHELSRLVGTARTRQLLERESNVYSFVTS